MITFKDIRIEQNPTHFLAPIVILSEMGNYLKKVNLNYRIYNPRKFWANTYPELHYITEDDKELALAKFEDTACSA